MFKMDNNVLLTIFVAVLSVAAGYFLPKILDKGAVPVYISTNETASLIYDADSPSKVFKVIYRDSTIVKENIYSNIIYVWNNGEDPIVEEDVRRPLQLVAQGGRAILDYKILKTSPDEIPNFSLFQIDSTRLGINYDYFDPDFGFQAQIIYAGDDKTLLVGEGYVLGSSFSRLHYSASQNSMLFLMLFILVGGGFLLSIPIRGIKDVIPLSYQRKTIVKSELGRIFMIILITLTGLFMVFLSVFSLYAFVTKYSYIPF